jgi:hypothetical protein
MKELLVVQQLEPKHMEQPKDYNVAGIVGTMSLRKIDLFEHLCAFSQ